MKTLTIRVIYSLMCVFTLGLSASLWAKSDAPDPATEAVILVATDALIDPVYARTVLVAKPAGGGMHVGVILNKQTSFALSALFPAHEPSKGVKENVYFGGPMARNTIAAVIPKNPDQKQSGVIEFTKNLYLVLHSEVIDTIIERSPNDARYYVGNVVWRPGELAMELEKGMWTVLPVSNEIVFRKDTSRLWKTLNDDSKLIYTQVPMPFSIAALMR